MSKFNTEWSLAKKKKGLINIIALFFGGFVDESGRTDALWVIMWIIWKSKSC